MFTGRGEKISPHADTWFFLYVLRQKLLEGVEDSSVGNDNRGTDLNLLLSF